MASHHPSPLFRLLTPLLQSLRSPLTTTTTRASLPKANVSATPSRTLSTTASLFARPKKEIKKDPRVTLIRYHMQHPKTPRPLRFSRMRALRHWTIHRAWMLFRRKQRDAERLELERMYNSTYQAMEALRTLDGPGEVNTGGSGMNAGSLKEGNKLYRIALEKKGIFRPGGVPIEYARAQVDNPGKEAWNHRWTR